MKARYIVIFLLTFIVISCSKETVSMSSCRQRYYYNNGQIIYLTGLNSELTVCFASAYNSQEKAAILSPYSFLNFIADSSGTSDESLIVLPFKSLENCQAASEKIALLDSNPNITIANLMLMYNGGLLGLSTQFNVQLKAGTSKQELDSLTIQTRTHITGQEKWDTLIYTISIDKHSNGDALDMANWFYMTNKFNWAQPDFFIVNGFN